MKVLVIGEMGLDRFIYGQVPRLCPEGPFLVFNPKTIEQNPGMAGNVQSNLRYFGAKTEILCNEKTIPIKTRYVDSSSGYLLLRVDEFDKVETLSEKKLEKTAIEKFDFVVISDYNKGFLSPELIHNILNRAKLSFLDTKKILGEWADKANFIKLNKKEYEANIAADSYLKGSRTKERLIVTLGAEGALWNNIQVPTKKIEVRNVSGAGDSMLAKFSIEYFKTKNVIKSLKKANRFASAACSRHGVISDFSWLKI